MQTKEAPDRAPLSYETIVEISSDRGDDDGGDDGDVCVC
jgi:hypothetical protein